MGWLWSSGARSSTENNLDPSLRAFLQKEEASTSPTPSLPSKPAQRPPQLQDAHATQTHAHAQAQAQPQAPPKPAVPPQSLFQDGRYAHLWKDYVPQQELENRSKTEQDKLRDIVDAYNDRRAEIGRIALENCSVEYFEQFECFRKPKTWTQTTTLCRNESRTFNRCYDVQSKFLKALGYLTMESRSAEDSEKIQMHADKLYQQMIEQEALIAKAKEEGREPPRFESVLSRQNISRAMAGKPLTATPVTGQPPPDEDENENEVWRHIKPESRKRYEKVLAGLPPEDQDFERKALLGELRANTGMAKQVEETFIEERIKRMQRREAGQATIGDTIKRLWGWG